MKETTIAGGASRKIETSIKRIARASVPFDTVELARALLGKVLVRRLRGGIAGGRIVETEAYLQNDPACHAFRGMTPRNRSLFLEHGHSYVYLCYGTSYLLNVSSEPGGIGSGVLLRALEPMFGTERMQRNVSHVKLADLTRGPGRLTAALRVDLSHDGLNLFTDSELWIGSDGHEVDSVGDSVRIGLTKGAEKRLRFFIHGSRHLSGPRRLNV